MKNKLALLLPIRCILFILSFLFISLILNKKLNDISYLWSVICTIINIALILFIILIIKVNKKSYYELVDYKNQGINKKELLIMILITFSLGLGGMYLAGLIIYFKIPYFSKELIAPIPLWIAIINIILLPITTAFVEDTIYLGFGVNNINNKYLKIIIPSFFFAIQHSFIPFVLDYKFMLYRFLSFLPLTIIFSYIYSKKKNLLTIMIAHALIDLFTAIWILIMSINPDLYNSF